MDNSQVQSRLTILGFTLAVLTFLISFLGTILGHEARAEGDWVIPIFFWSYLNTFLPIVLGFMLCLVGILCLLGAQAKQSQDWFDMGQVALFLALSQALSGFNEVIARVVQAAWTNAPGHRFAAAIMIFLLAMASQALWLALLWMPFAVLRRRGLAAAAPRRLWVATSATVGLVLIVPGLGFYLRDPGNGRWDALLGKIVVQVFRPLSWLLGV